MCTTFSQIISVSTIVPHPNLPPSMGAVTRRTLAVSHQIGSRR